MQGLSLKTKLLTVLLLAFLAGILYVNLATGLSGDAGELFSTSFFEQFRKVEIDTGKYILYLLRVRILPITTMIALAFTRFRKISAWGFVGWTCFLGGYLMGLAVIHLGMKGSLFCIVGIFPQILCYIPAYIVVIWYSLLDSQRRWDMQKTVFIIGSMAGGILLEALVNPMIMKLFLAIL